MTSPVRAVQKHTGRYDACPENLTISLKSISQGDERDDVTHLTILWLPSTDLAVWIQGLFF